MYLEQNNIKYEIHYPKPFYDTNAYKNNNFSKCETMDKYKNKLLSLPMYPELDKSSVRYICETINKF